MPEGWECVENCPVRLMDEMSGIRPTSKAGMVHKGPRYTGNAYNNGKAGGEQKEYGYGDSGGASRFFKTFPPQEEESLGVGEATILHGDCVEKMREIPESSVDAIVCDPPYFLRFMGRKWDHAPSPKEQQIQHEAWAREAIRVLKPGGYMLAFGGTRTVHRLACAIEDAGFEIRDRILHVRGGGAVESSPGEINWVYGSG